MPLSSAQGPTWICLLWRAEWEKSYQGPNEATLSHLNASHVCQSLLCSGSCIKDLVQGAHTEPDVLGQRKTLHSADTTQTQQNLGYKEVGSWPHRLLMVLQCLQAILCGRAGRDLCLTAQLGRWLWGRVIQAPSFTPHCKVCCSHFIARENIISTRNWNDSAWTCEVHYDHQKLSSWPSWRSINSS